MTTVYQDVVARVKIEIENKDAIDSIKKVAKQTSESNILSKAGKQIQKSLSSGFVELNDSIIQNIRLKERQKEIKDSLINKEDGILLKALPKQFDNFRTQMTLTNETWAAQYVAGFRSNTMTGKLAEKTRMFTQGLKGFRMQLLGVMFAGQQLQKAMSGLMQNSLQSAGVFDILGTTLEVLFLPIALAILDVLLPIADFFMNLPEPIQFAIGAIVLIVGAIGGFLAILGAVGLAIGSGISMFAGFFGAVSTLAGGIIAALAPIILPILAIIAVIALLWLAWQTNFGNIRQHVENIINAVKSIFDGFVKYITGIMDIVVGILTLNPEKIKEGFQKIIDGVGQIIHGFVDIGKNIIGFIVDGIKQAADWIWNALINLPYVGPIIKMIGEGIGNIAKGVVEFGSSVATAISDFLSGGSRVKDFISRPGQGMTSIDPGDTVFGMKDLSQLGGGGTVINVTVQGNASRETADEIARQVDRVLNDSMKRMAR